MGSAALDSPGGVAAHEMLPHAHVLVSKLFEPPGLRRRLFDTQPDDGSEVKLRPRHIYPSSRVGRNYPVRSRVVPGYFQLVTPCVNNSTLVRDEESCIELLDGQYFGRRSTEHGVWGRNKLSAVVAVTRVAHGTLDNISKRVARYVTADRLPRRRRTCSIECSSSARSTPSSTARVISLMAKASMSMTVCAKDRLT